jgi:hypothetical protein
VVYKQLLYGLATFVPGVARIFGRGTCSSGSARYCYAVWLRHLVTAFQNGLARHPRAVAELGPGGSLGMGLAALLSGADSYQALDVVRHANVAGNLAVFDQLVTLFANRTPIPDEQEFPQIRPTLTSYAFPEQLCRAHMAAMTCPERLARIRASIRGQNRPGSMIHYRVPWFDESILERDGLDLVFSQAVMEHVDDLAGTYQAIRKALRVGGLLSHQIDFRSHQMVREWNGHWSCPDFLWRLIRGRRRYLLNRQPCSTHLGLLADHGFQVVGVQRMRSPTRLARAQLSSRFTHVTDDDLTTSGALIQATKQ